MLFVSSFNRKKVALVATYVERELQKVGISFEVVSRENRTLVARLPQGLVSFECPHNENYGYCDPPHHIVLGCPLHSESADASWPVIHAIDAARASVANAAQSGFPRYLMIVDGKRRWLPLGDAGVVYDSGWVSVNIGGKVCEADGTERDITDAERNRISVIADEHSGNK